MSLDAAEILALNLTLRGHSLKQIAYELHVSNALACRIRQLALMKIGAVNVCHFVMEAAIGNVPGFELCKTEHSVDMTEAELQVARQVALGHSNAAIARTRGTAERTVANQLASLYRKFRVQSRVELVTVLASARAL
jgi:DNA-binding CsgD family transcriptional regulator